jgi:hypothetical protein
MEGGSYAVGMSLDKGKGVNLSAAAFRPLLGTILPLQGRFVNTLTGEIGPADPRTTLGLSNAHNGPSALVKIAFDGRLFALTNPNPDGRLIPRGERGEITEFSRQSRKRLMQLFASVAESAVRESAVFIGLTYHRDWPATPAGCRAQLRAFLKSLRRQYPNTAVIWRLEFQRRGAPHYHLLVVGTPFVDSELVTTWWGDIAHGESEYHGRMATNTQQIKTWYHACAYVSKEIAKVSQSKWGEKNGRYWGVEGRQFLPAEVDEIPLTLPQFSRLKEIVMSRMPAEHVNHWLRNCPVGCWSMIPGEEGLRMLAWALSCNEPADLYQRQPSD